MGWCINCHRKRDVKMEGMNIIQNSWRTF
jgi:hypothetical protein